MMRISQNLSFFKQTRVSPTFFIKRHYFNVEKQENNKIVEKSRNITRRENKCNLEKNTIARTIERDVGLKRFLERVYVTAGFGITTSLIIPAAGIAFAPQLIQQATPFLIIGGFLSGMAGSIGLNFTKYKINKEKTESRNSLPRQLSFFSVVGGTSLMLMPVAAIMHGISPTIWPTATAMSLTTMGVVTLWARSRPVDSLLTWEGPLYGGLVVLIGNSFAAIAAKVFFSASGIGELLHFIDITAGIGLFTAMTAYETHKAVAMYRAGDPDHLACATFIYLDFVNLLIRIAEILSKLKEND